MPDNPQWSPFGEPTCPERSPKTGDRCVVGGDHHIHGADFTDWWSTPEPNQWEQQQRDMIAAGHLTEDGKQKHTCPWCCQSYGFVEAGARQHYETLTAYLDSLPWWWRYRHPVRHAYHRGSLECVAIMLDDMGK